MEVFSWRQCYVLSIQVLDSPAFLIAFQHHLVSLVHLQNPLAPLPSPICFEDQVKWARRGVWYKCPVNHCQRNEGKPNWNGLGTAPSTSLPKHVLLYWITSFCEVSKKRHGFDTLSFHHIYLKFDKYKGYVREIAKTKHSFKLCSHLCCSSHLSRN